MKNFTRGLLVLYISTAVILLCEAQLASIDYQDIWVLDGILLPTLGLVLAFALCASYIEKLKILTLVCASFLIIMNLAPVLKYSFLYGDSDSINHYGYIMAMLENGRVPETGYYGAAYSANPGMHLLMSAIVIVTGASAVAVARFTLPLLFGLVPLLFYHFTNHFQPRIRRYVVIGSTLSLPPSYVLLGRTFATLLLIVFVVVMLLLMYGESSSRRSYTVVLYLSFLAILLSHGVTPLYLVGFLVGALMLSTGYRMVTRRTIARGTVGMHGKVQYTRTVLLLGVLLFSWWAFVSLFYFEKFATILGRILLTERFVRTPIPSRLFEISIDAQLRILLLFHVKDIILIALGFAGFVFIIKRRNSIPDAELRILRPLFFICAAVYLMLILQLLSGFGTLEYYRFLEYASLLVVPFVGIALSTFRIRRPAGRKAFLVLLIFILISLSLIQNFKYQPLVPRANVLSSSLPTDQYIYNFGMVNSISKISMIKFAEDHYPYLSDNKPRITSDIATRWQIYGLTNLSFSTNHIYFSPLTDNQYRNKWDIFLLHYGEHSGSFHEKAENVTRVRIEAFRLNNNIIYDNGESFILTRPGQASVTPTNASSVGSAQINIPIIGVLLSKTPWGDQACGSALNVSLWAFYAGIDCSVSPFPTLSQPVSSPSLPQSQYSHLLTPAKRFVPSDSDRMLDSRGEHSWKRRQNGTLGPGSLSYYW